jgi:hypothetical protein
VSEKNSYKTNLSAGLGHIEETKVLLELWTPGMSVKQLFQKALASGQFPNITAARLTEIVEKCFAARYLINNGAPATYLKILMKRLNPAEIKQLFYLFTCRASNILRDFVIQVYWEKYAGGHYQITNQDAQAFINSALNNGKMEKPWSESTIRRNAGYLTGCCADYGLLANGVRTVRKILPFRAGDKTMAFLAYDLHFAGLGDNAMLNHADWNLFGFNRHDVLAEIKRISLKGFFIVQAAGDVVKISWRYQNMEELCDVLIQS